MRIVIFGCGGSGKSTLARLLGERLNIPVIHLDQLYWRPGWKHITDMEFDALLEEVLAGEEWIIDGNYNRTLPLRLEHCDTAIYLDFSRFTCLRGAFGRVIRYYGKTRPDMGRECPECFDLQFLVWIWTFHKKNRSNYHRMLSELQGKEVHILRARKELKPTIEVIATRHKQIKSNPTA